MSSHPIELPSPSSPGIPTEIFQASKRGAMAFPFGARVLALGYYAIFGLLHELSHLLAARILLGPDVFNCSDGPDGILRALLGRYTLLRLPVDLPDDADDTTWRVSAVRHAGWAFSLVLALGLLLVRRSRGLEGKEESSDRDTIHRKSKGHEGRGSWIEPAAVAACLTALEAAVTDLLGFVPRWDQVSPLSPSALTFCERAVEVRPLKCSISVEPPMAY